tara:strand:- start:1819 stop:2781 length:963 start_codon:yes stop_codon:yes gene_type:complete
MFQKKSIKELLVGFFFIILQTIGFFFFFTLAMGFIFAENLVLLGLLMLACALYCLPVFRRKVNKKSIKDAIASKKGQKELKKDIADALADGVLTDDEFEQLKAKASELNLSEDVIYQARYQDFEQRSRPIIDEIEQTRRYSPAQEQNLRDTADKLRVIPQFESAFDVYRALWSYENDGVLDIQPLENVPIILKSGEECYFSTDATWLQVKKVTEHKGYVGAGLGFRVAKGVRFSVGRGIPVKNTYEEMQPISDGEIYITNKRIIFNGVKKSTNVTYGRLIQLELYQNGIEVRKTTGKPDFFEIPEVYAEYISAIVHDVLN